LAPDDGEQPGALGQAVSEVSERATLLIREEIELAKTEISEKVSSLIKGAVVGIAAGIFVVVGLLFLLHAAAWGLFAGLFDDVYLGYLVVAGILFLLGGLAGFLATKAVKRGTPPKPEMAIDEAKRIKETVQHGSGAGART
jgi:putative superfamily III holin-X